MGRYLNLNREAAARFSFLLSVPVILAAGLWEGRELVSATSTGVPISFLVVGFLSSAFFGFLSIHWLIRLISTSSFALFAWYRIIVSCVVVLLSVIFKM